MPVRGPDGWPTNTLKAMRAAILAESIGRAVAFSLAAFRQAFAGGPDLSDVTTCSSPRRKRASSQRHPQSHRDAVRQGQAPRGDRGGVRARRQGVPTIAVGDQLFFGDDHLLDEAASALAAA